MFLAGFLGNLLCQAIRAALNLALSAVLIAVALPRLLLGSLMLLGGGWAKGASSCASAWETTKRSGSALAVGCVQGIGAATLVTPLLRGAQASSETFRMQGVYAPNAPDANGLQKIFGLNSWENAPKKAVPKREEVRPNLAEIKVETRTRSTDLNAINIKEVPRTKSTPRPKASMELREWEGLARAYVESRTVSEADRVRLKMATRHPRLYLMVLKAAGSRTR